MTRFRTAALDEPSADAILADAARLLQADDGGGDVPCPIGLQRSGPLGAFALTDGTIDTQAELTMVFNQAQVPGEVKVVNAIDWCENRFDVWFLGCGEQPGASFIVERTWAALEGVLWAHEYGHNRGLGHRNDANAVMHPACAAGHRAVNTQECSAL